MLKHPDFIKEVTEHSKPYLYHVFSEIKKRKLPGELALIPMLESTYDPFVSSSSGAAGLWQLMPKTGHDLGLKKDWWVDGRRSIGPSTNAALNYLAYLHGFFKGDWMLAVAAYQSGEGTVAKAVKRSHQRQFWALPLPHSTKKYIPRLLALSEIIEHPNQYHIKLPEIPSKPYFAEVNINNPHVDLNHAAELAKIPLKELLRLNPGFIRLQKHRSYQPYKLLIPTTHIGEFNHNLANIELTKQVKKPESKLLTKQERKESISKRPKYERSYTVKRGDSLYTIAHKHKLKLSALLKLNPGISRSKTLKPGMKLNIG